MGTSEKIRCLLIQTDLIWADALANRQRLEVIVRVRGEESDLIIFPETFTSGFLGDDINSLEAMDGVTVAWMKRLANEMDCVLCGSMAMAAESGTVNRFLWVQPDGVVQYYDKRHLFTFGGETRRYVAGTERVVIDYRGWRICPQICYDLRFPVWCRNQADYDILLLVANWPEPRTPAWSALLRARAIENQCYVVAVNRCGSDARGLVYAGASAVYDPLGETLLDLADEETVGGVDIELQKVNAIREELPFQHDVDKFELL